VSESPEYLANHLQYPLSRGHIPDGAVTGAAGGAACGDLIRISLRVEDDGEGLIGDAGFDADGCGATIAAGSAVMSLVRGVPLLQAARIGASDISDELGGLAPTKSHAAELAADALHRALGAAAREHAGLSASASRTLVAMSGGVDSAMAALLVTQGGSDAVGVTLELWSDPENDGDLSCCSAQAVRGARDLAHGLGMPHLSINLRAEFRAGVVEGWLADHAAGLTPNPCVRCNGNVRLDAMLELADRLGSQTLATGHYARVEEGPLLRMAADVAKDQSYVLCALGPDSLARMRFPLGELHKPQVRELAERARVPVARRPDSQDLCFLAGTGQRTFLARHGGLGARPGPIVDLAGQTLGEHAGAHVYTVGQRHGLGISSSEPLYVLATDTGSNTVTVGPRHELLASSLTVAAATLHSEGACVDAVRVRAHGRMHPCAIDGDLQAGAHDLIAVALRDAVERTAACLYSGDLVVGHGTITALPGGRA
jgi:tRNA-specific 2-thiouridylase